VAVAIVVVSGRRTVSAFGVVRVARVWFHDGMDIEQVCDELQEVAGRLGAIEVDESIAPAGVRRGMTELSRVRAAVMRLQLAFTSRAAVQAETGEAPPVLDVLTGAGKVSTREATESVRHVELLRLLPRVAAALGAGRLVEGHLAVLATARRRLDPALRNEFDGHDAGFAAAGGGLSPDRFKRHIALLVRQLEASMAQQLDIRRRRACRLSKHVDAISGMYRLSGEFDPETGARLFGAIDATVNRLRQHPESLIPGDDPHDPLGTEPEFIAAHALARLVTAGRVADRPGTAEVVVLIDHHTLQHGAHDRTVAELHDGTPLDPATIGRLCCDAAIRAVVTSADGRVPLSVGRESRTATPEQRRALRAVHRDCAIDDCDVRFDWCQIHHIDPWDPVGLTDLNNLVPLCTRHHHLVHEGRWQLQLEPHDRTLTLTTPDGTTYRTMRPPGLAPPTAA